MELRKELLPIERTDEFKGILRIKIETIEHKIENKEDATREIEEFNKFTGREYDLDYFKNYYTFISLDDFIQEASSPIPKKVLDIKKEELIEIVRRIIDCERYGEDTDFYVNLLEVNVLIPGVLNLIFWNEEELTLEQIVEKALSYKPVLL